MLSSWYRSGRFLSSKFPSICFVTMSQNTSDTVKLFRGAEGWSLASNVNCQLVRRSKASPTGIYALHLASESRNHHVTRGDAEKFRSQGVELERRNIASVCWFFGASVSPSRSLRKRFWRRARQLRCCDRQKRPRNSLCITGSFKQRTTILSLSSCTPHWAS